MATRKSAKKRAGKSAKKRAGTKRAAKAGSRRRPAKRAARPRPARKRAATRAAKPKLRPGVVTHTELASTDPAATKAWCEKALGWKFGSPMPTPQGPYHMWQFPNGTGGGIRANNPPEAPGSIPYCEVADIRASYSKALAAGATAMMPPEEIPGGMGWIAIVAAPGGVAIGFWSPG